MTLLMAFGFYASAFNPQGGRDEGTYFPVVGGFDGSATITAQISIDGEAQTSEDLEVGAFIGEQCRGAYKLEEYDTDVYVVYLSVAGDASGDGGKTITFQVYDHATNQLLPVSCSTTLTWTNNASWGDIEPIMIEFFNTPTFTITVTANPAAGGVVTGGGSYEENASATITATANTGYTFVNWTKGGTEVSTNASYTFTVTEAAEYVANFELIPTYTITVTANPTAGGVVTGGGTYEENTSVTITATANTGYTFVNWTKGGTEVSTNASYTFTVTEAGAYVANFEAQTFTITTSVDPDFMGTVTGAGTYTYGQTCTLTATPTNEHYEFLMWTKDDVSVAETEEYSFTVTEDGEYVAKFTGDYFLIGAHAVRVIEDEDAGEVTGGGGYYYGQTATLTATAYTGYNFVEWRKDNPTDGTSVSTETTYVIDPVTESGDYYAIFEVVSNYYDITTSVNPEGAGTVTGAGNYAEGASCTLTATPANPGATFISWTKGGTEVSTTNPYTFTVTEDAEYVANFSVETYIIGATVNPEGAGTVTGMGGYTYGENCTLEATATGSYVFDKWTREGAEVSTENPYTFEVTESGDYVANFLLGVTVTVEVVGGSGNITGAGTYFAGDEVTLSATANPGSDFLWWVVDGTQISDNPYTFTVTEDITVQAVFSSEVYMITATANPNDGGTLTGFGGYTYGQTCTLTATPNEGYLFQNWTINGAEVSTSATYSFSVTESADFVANFVEGVVITVTCNPEDAGTVTGGGTYAAGETVTLTATPVNPGSTFLFWTLNGETVSETPSFDITVTESAEYVANFSVETYIITVSANPNDGGTVTGAGAFHYGETCTLTATPADGYVFQNWTLNGAEVSTNATYSFEVTESGDYVANFVIGYEITAECVPALAGTITGTGTYTEGQTCTLSVVPANTESYTFLCWTLNGETVSETETFSFTVIGNAHYVAMFTYETYLITATANPTDAGTVDGMGGYLYGEECTLTAEPNTGYAFVNWTLNGAEVSTNATYTFTVTEAGDYVANFEETNAYTITVVSNPEGAGNLTGGGYYNEGASCTITAEAIDGYTFINWTLNGEVVSDAASYTFTVTEDAEYVANFSQNLYYINVEMNNEAGGQTFGGGYFLYGHWCILHAVPNDGYTFVNWTVNGTEVCNEPIYRFQVTETLTVVANFTLTGYQVTATANPAAGGNISGAGSYNHGASCTLTATANNGYTFVNWTKDGEVVSTNASYTFTVNENAAYVANFDQTIYTITVAADPADAAFVFVSGGMSGDFTYGQTCTLRMANIAAGYEFVSWTLNGTVVSTDPTYSFTVTSSNHYVANFANRGVLIRAFINTRPDAGEIIGTGYYQVGESVTLTVVPADGYLFTNWVDENDKIVSEEVTFSFVAETDRDFYANLREYTGIGENTISVSLFPNPASTTLKVTTDQANYQLDIYTITGALVRSMSNCSNITEVDVQDLTSGTYIIRLSNSESVETRRFVKE